MKYSKFVVNPWHCEPETWSLDAPKSRHWHIVAEPHGGAGYGAGAVQSKLTCRPLDTLPAISTSPRMRFQCLMYSIQFTYEAVHLATMSQISMDL